MIFWDAEVGRKMKYLIVFTLTSILLSKNESEYSIRPTIIAAIMEIIFCDILMLYQVFLSPQVKQSTVISNKQGVYELPHELPNDLRLTILGN